MVGWRREEEISLCNKLQRAFNHVPPRLPDLTETAMTVGHSTQETEEKARELLRVMFSTAYPQMARQEIQSEVHALIQSWR